MLSRTFRSTTLDFGLSGHLPPIASLGAFNHSHSKSEQVPEQVPKQVPRQIPEEVPEQQVPGQARSRFWGSSNHKLIALWGNSFLLHLPISPRSPVIRNLFSPTLCPLFLVDPPLEPAFHLSKNILWSLPPSSSSSCNWQGVLLKSLNMVFGRSWDDMRLWKQLLLFKNLCHDSSVSEPSCGISLLPAGNASVPSLW